MKFLSFLTSIVSLLMVWITSKREDKLREEGKIEAENITIKKREEAVNAQSKTSYTGSPSALADWMRNHNATKK